MHGAIGGGLPPGVQEWMIPGNRPEDEFWEQVNAALKKRLALAKHNGEIPKATRLEDLKPYVDRAFGIVGWNAKPWEVAEEALNLYIWREEDGDGPDGEEAA